MDISGLEQTEHVMAVGGNYAALILIVGVCLYFFVRWKGYRPNFILFMIIYLFPTSVFYIDVGFHLFFHRILLIFYLIWFCFSKIFKFNDIKKLMNATTLSAFYFLIMCVPGVLVSIDIGSFLRWWVSILSGILFYMVILDKIKNKQALYDMLFTCIVVGFAWAATGLFLFAIGNPTLQVQDIRQVYRVSALSSDANFFASILIAWIQISFFWLIRRNIRNRLFVFVALVVMLAAFILTYSRGGFLALVFIGILNFVYLLFFRGRFRSVINFNLVRVSGIIMVILVIGSIFAVGSLRDRILSIGGDSRLGAGRGYIWMDAIEVIKQNPLGVGLNNYREYTVTNRTKYRYPGSSVHNLFLHLTAETGIQGIISYFLFLFTIIIKIRHLKNIRDGDISHWFVGTYIAFIGILVCSLFISNIYRENVFLAIAMFLALFQMHTAPGRPYIRVKGIPAGVKFMPNNLPHGK